ncbi:hypothetical protein MXB_2001 [Myxobolus squamalis]|nr:hypothetical protein MXB_2001 [Myxobolus squamalis]
MAYTAIKVTRMIDNLPVLSCSSSLPENRRMCATHFFIGCTTKTDSSYPRCLFGDKPSDFDYIILNHLKFFVTYRVVDGSPKTAEILEVNVVPESYFCVFKFRTTDCNVNDKYLGFNDGTNTIHAKFSYSVVFIKNQSLNYEYRFNYIYNNNEYGHIRWVSIILSIVIVLALSTICAYLLVRAVRSDISKYTELLNTGFDTQDEYGWKLLKGDIFRAPRYRLLLAVSIGNGIQIVLYILLGTLSGFISARIYKFFDGEHWKMCVLASALLHPGTFVSIPLTFIGSIYGFKRRAIKSPVKKNLIPRTIPRQTFYSKRIVSILLGGFICFLLRHSYVMFGLLYFAAILLVVVCAEVSVVFCYFHLCAEDYRWQWRSFLTVGFTAFYCFIYIALIYSQPDRMSLLGGFVYFGYSFIMIYMLLLATGNFFLPQLGSVGFLSCFYVLLKMFSSIKT